MYKDILLYFALLLWFVVPSQAQPTIFSPDVVVEENKQIEVDVMASGFETLIGLQFAIDWDHDVLSYVSVEDFTLPFAGSNNYNISNSGKLRIQWYGDAAPIEDDQVLFKIKFITIGEPNESSPIIFTDDLNAGGTPFLKELIDGNVSIIGDVVYTDGTVTIDGPMPTNTLELNTQFQLFQNEPNPFQHTTNIKFELKETEMISFSIFNTVGKEIYSHTAKYTEGLHTLSIDYDDLPTSGVYFYQLRSELNRICKTMIFNK